MLIDVMFIKRKTCNLDELRLEKVKLRLRTSTLPADSPELLTLPSDSLELSISLVDSPEP